MTLDDESTNSNDYRFPSKFTHFCNSFRIMFKIKFSILDVTQKAQKSGIDKIKTKIINNYQMIWQMATNRCDLNCELYISKKKKYVGNMLVLTNLKNYFIFYALSYLFIYIFKCCFQEIWNFFVFAKISLKTYQSSSATPMCL